MTKPTKWPVRPVKTQISLGIGPVWSESSLNAWRRGIHPVWSESSPSAWRSIWSLATHHKAHSKDSDQTGWMPRLIQVFAGRTSYCWISHATARIRCLHCFYRTKKLDSCFPAYLLHLNVFPTTGILSKQICLGCAMWSSLNSKYKGKAILVPLKKSKPQPIQSILAAYIFQTKNSKWAASWQNQQCGCAPSENSDQPGYPPCLIRFFAVRSMGS